MFLVYRLFISVYLAGWLIALGVDRSDSLRPFWFIFITNWSFLFLVFVSCVAALVSLIYFGFFIGKNETRGRPKAVAAESHAALLYSQDNIHWSVKVFWFLYIVSTTAMVMVFFGFWVVVYESCDGDSGSSSSQNASESRNGSFTTEDDITESCGADVLSIHAHGVNAAIVMLDILLCLVPFNALHFFYPCVFSVVFVAFSGIYFALGGTNELGQPFIYSALNYNNSTSPILAALGFAIIPAAVYLIPFILAFVRDRTYHWIVDNHSIYCCNMKTCTNDGAGKRTFSPEFRNEVYSKNNDSRNVLP